MDKQRKTTTSEPKKDLMHLAKDLRASASLMNDSQREAAFSYGMQLIYVKSAAILLLAGLFLAGCVTQADLSKADWGPVPNDPEGRTRAYFEQTLKDPDSARYKFGALKKGWLKEGLVYGGATRFGWVQIVSVNAKNGYGGYTGYETHYILFLGRKVYDITAAVNAHMGGFLWDSSPADSPKESAPPI